MTYKTAAYHANRCDERARMGQLGRSPIGVMLDIERARPISARMALLNRANDAGRQDLIALASRKAIGLDGFGERVDAAWSELELLLTRVGA